MKIEMYIKKECSLFFLTALKPMKKAMISVGNTISTVASHQCPLSKSTIPSNIKIKNVIINNINKTVNPTDHLPNQVFGNKEVFIILTPSYSSGMVLSHIPLPS